MSSLPAEAIRVDEELLLQFVVWNLRTRDLPHTIKQAAARLAAARLYPKPPGSETYIEAPFRVSVIPHTDTGEIIDASADRASVPALVAERLIEHRPKFLLITDLGERA